MASLKFNNYNLFKLFLQVLLQKSYSDKEMKSAGAVIRKNIKELIWTIILVNTTSEDLLKLKSANKKEVQKAIKTILSKATQNPQIIEEIKSTLQKILVKLNEEVSI